MGTNTYLHIYIHTCIRTYIRTDILTYIHKLINSCGICNIHVKRNRGFVADDFCKYHCFLFNAIIHSCFLILPSVPASTGKTKRAHCNYGVYHRNNVRDVKLLTDSSSVRKASQIHIRELQAIFSLRWRPGRSSHLLSPFFSPF